MISKKQRLPLSSISNFFKQSRSKENDFLKIFYRQNNLGYNRFAVIAPNKNFRTLVLRNKTRRQVKAILRNWDKERQFSNLKPEFNFDLIVLIKKPPSRNKLILKNSLLNLLESLNNF